MQKRIVVVALTLLALSGALWAFRTLRPLPPLPRVARGPAQNQIAALDPSPETRRRGGLDVTFLVFSDTHFGYGGSERDLLGRRRDPVANPEGTELVNARAIESMNTIAGKPWPAVLGGSIGAPLGLLISGDLTEDGEAWQWHGFTRYYGLDGKDGRIRYPVFEGHGNHDKQGDWYVLNRIRERHGDLNYSFDWHDLHLVCLGEAPDKAALDWLGRDLARVGKQRPILIYFHFPLQGPYAENNWFARGDYRDGFAATIGGFNVIAVFHGHYHASGRYHWRDWDVYNVGAAKHRRHSFAVANVNDQRLRVAAWHFDELRWEWWHDKPINGAPGSAVEGGVHAYNRPEN